MTLALLALLALAPADAAAEPAPTPVVTVTGGAIRGVAVECGAAFDDPNGPGLPLLPQFTTASRSHQAFTDTGAKTEVNLRRKFCESR